MKASFAVGTSVRLVSAYLTVVPGAFYLLWLSTDVPAILRGTTPQDLVETGLFTNPVHVLDISVFLPACILAGALLRRRRAWGYCLAPILLCAMAAIGLGIVCLMIVLAARGEDASLVLAALMGTLSLVPLELVRRFLRTISPGTNIEAHLRQPEDAVAGLVSSGLPRS